MTPDASASDLQAFRAAWYWGVPVKLRALFGKPLLAVGSGKLGTPCARTHLLNASSSFVTAGGVGPPLLPAGTVDVVVSDPTFATPGEADPPQAAARRLVPTSVAAG
jgi:hypothetical protein